MNENHWNGENPKQLTIMIVQKDAEKPAFLCFSGVDINALGKRGQFHINVNTHLLYDPAIPVLGICPKEEKIYIQ